MTGPAYQTVNPAPGERVRRFETARDSDIETALTSAHQAQAAWRAVPIAERAEIVKRVGALFVERADDLAALATLEMGKSLEEGRGEAEFCGSILDYYATEGPGLAADTEIKSFSGGRAVVQKLPIGALLGVMPWNFPYYQIARFVAPNLMLGNTVILKHAESVPQCALAVQQIMDDAGVPAGVYVNVFASHEQIETIIADPRIQGVSLTGSERAGAIVGALAGKHLKKCVLELGGSDPYVLLDTPDVDAAAETAWGTRMYNTGQACNSNKRMIVMNDIYAEFVESLTQRAKETTTFAPMSSRAAAVGLAAQVEDAVSKGATLHAGGQLSEAPAAYYSPTVLTGITRDMRAYSEELFGPVAVVYSVDSDEAALKLANDTVFGLGGAVFSSDEDRAARLATQLEVGMTNVNTPAGEGPEIPFGGVKRSGFGRELGPLGMDEFVNKRMFYIAD